MMPLPMHWAKAVFPVFKEPGGAAAILPLICSSSPTAVLCWWELGPRSCVESTDPGVRLLCHPWGQETVHWCLLMKDPEDLCRICPGMTRLWSTPRLFVRATCGRGGGSPHHLVTSLWHSMGNEILVLSTCCHLMPILELWVQQHRLACLHAVEKLYEQWISLPHRQLLQSGTLPSPSCRGPSSTRALGA